MESLCGELQRSRCLSARPRPSQARDQTFTSVHLVHRITTGYSGGKPTERSGLQDNSCFSATAACSGSVRSTCRNTNPQDDPLVLHISRAVHLTYNTAGHYTSFADQQDKSCSFTGHPQSATPQGIRQPTVQTEARANSQLQLYGTEQHSTRHGNSAGQSTSYRDQQQQSIPCGADLIIRPDNDPVSSTDRERAGRQEPLLLLLCSAVLCYAPLYSAV